MKKRSGKELRKLRQRNKTEEELRVQKSEAAVHRCFAATLMTLRDEFGFGGKRIERFMEGVVMQIACMHGNYVSPNDVFQQIYEETDFCYPEFMNKSLGGK